MGQDLLKNQGGGVSFCAKVPAKWVLSGEHAVLRGCTAITMPHPDFFLELSFKPSDQNELQIFPSEYQKDILELYQKLSQKIKGLKLPQGELHLNGNIPVRAGLGSSAAVCVAIVKWMLPEEEKNNRELISELATYLEDTFHKKSSGMDVAAVTYEKPLVFKSGQTPRVLDISEIPKFSFHDTGLRVLTSQAVEKVKVFCEAHQKDAKEIDAKMDQASLMCEKGLVIFHQGQKEKGLELIQKSMNQSFECFEKWGLVCPQVKELAQKLKQQGALACRLTGAGDGGFLVALWP